MLVFNIRKAEYAQTLLASGIANRWNKQDEYVIYTSGSRSLCTLELLAHRAYIQADKSYKILEIELDISDQDITTIDENQLPKRWKSILSYPSLQELGSKWYQSFSTLVLGVPSVIIPEENNFIINSKHPDFSKKVKIKSAETFAWDERLL